MGFQLTGSQIPTAATQLGLFAASTNATVVYMTWVDGQGYRLWRVRGLFLADGLVALGAAIPLLWLLQHPVRNLRRAAGNHGPMLPVPG